MSPWKVLGWLLVALLCLLLTAGAYGLALLWGWSLPSVWWLAAIAGAGAGVALIIFCSAQYATIRMNPPLPARGVAFERLPAGSCSTAGDCSALARHFESGAARFFPMAQRKARYLSDYGARRTPIDRC